MYAHTEAALVIFAFKAGVHCANVFEFVFLRADFVLSVYWFWTYTSQRRHVHVGATGKVVQLLLFICAFVEWTSADFYGSWSASALRGLWTVSSLLVILDVANYLDAHKLHNTKLMCQLVREEAIMLCLLRSVALFGYSALSLGWFQRFVICVCECVSFVFVVSCIY